MLSNLRENDDHIRKQSKEKIAACLLRGFASSDFTPITLADEPSAVVQLQYLFETLKPHLQERFKAATLLALAEWNPKAHGTPVLKQLVLLSAYIRATQVIDQIRTIIENRFLDVLKLNDDEYADTVQILLGVVAGFAPLPDVEIFFERLFFADLLDYRFAAQLFLGLCECQPENYTEYVPKFLRILEKHPGYYKLEYVFAELVRIVTLRRIVANIGKLRPPCLRSFLELLCSYDWSPASLALLDEKTESIFLVLRPEFNPEPQEFALPSDLGDNIDFFQMFYEIKKQEITQHGGTTSYIDRLLETVKV